MSINRWWYGIIMCCMISVYAESEFIKDKPRKSKKKSALKEELVNARKELAYVYNKEVAETAQAQDRNIEAIESVIENKQSVSRADLKNMISNVNKEVSDARIRIQQLQKNKK